MKNLILLKDLPAIEIYGVIYQRPAGTVYAWDGDEEWDLIPEYTGGNITKEDLKNNSDFYKLTTKTPTYNKPLEINNKPVVFLKGEIKIGCVNVDNKTVLEIASLLKD